MIECGVVSSVIIRKGASFLEMKVVRDGFKQNR